MIKKIGGFLEEHVEKIVLIIVGLLCSWLLITRVLLTPNVIEHGDDVYTPGNIDEKISSFVDDLKKKKDNTPLDINPPEVRNYDELLASPLAEFSFVLSTQSGLPTIDSDAVYEEPQIARVRISDIDIEHLRVVVYEPFIEVTKSQLYEDDISEPNDLDLITVSGYIDIERIVQEFKRCYDNSSLKELADPCKAKPIFACVDLQRQSLNPDGSWSSWVHVPRTKIDSNRDIFKYRETYADLPIGGLPVYKYQLNHTLTQLELLQPEPYQIASAEEEWLPPELHRDFVSAQKRDEREARRLEVDSTTTDTGGRRGRGNTTANTGRNDTTTTTGGNRRGGNTRRGNTNVGAGYDNTPTRSRTNTRTDVYGTEEDLYVNEVYDEFESVILSDTTDIMDLDEPILFWAHDDTAAPDNTYRYRMRVGVLNPTAKQKDDQLIFWTGFSEITPEIFIPGKIYFFAGEVQEAAKTVSISVYKLALGKWYKKVFDRIGQGEMIGGIVDIERDDTEDENGRITETDEPETVDFTTGATMVDVVRASEWAGGSSTRSVPYYDMTYTYDGTEILHMPATKTPNTQIWPPRLYDAYRYVLSMVNEDREPFREWGSSEIQIQDIRGGDLYRRGYR